MPNLRGGWVGTKGIAFTDTDEENGADGGECKLPGGIDTCVLNEALVFRPPR